MQVVKFFLAEPGQMFHIYVQICWKLVWYPKREGGWNISLMQAYCNLLRAGSWQKYDSKPSSKIYHSKPREYIGKMHWIQNLPLFFSNNRNLIIFSMNNIPGILYPVGIRDGPKNPRLHQFRNWAKLDKVWKARISLAKICGKALLNS